MSDKYMTMSIRERDADEFLSNLKSVLGSMDPEDVEELRLYVKGRDAIAISFDAELHPFLGRTAGLNEEEQRTRGLNESLFVTRLIQARLGAERPEGGRVFLTSTRAYWVENAGDADQGDELPLVDWDWPGKDLVDTVRALKEEASEA
jgi:hypothetical protein